MGTYFQLLQTPVPFYVHWIKLIVFFLKLQFNSETYCTFNTNTLHTCIMYNMWWGVFAYGNISNFNMFNISYFSTEHITSTCCETTWNMLYTTTDRSFLLTLTCFYSSWLFQLLKELAVHCVSGGVSLPTDRVSSDSFQNASVWWHICVDRSKFICSIKRYIQFHFGSEWHWILYKRYNYSLGIKIFSVILHLY